MTRRSAASITSFPGGNTGNCTASWVSVSTLASVTGVEASPLCCSGPSVAGVWSGDRRSMRSPISAMSRSRRTIGDGERIVSAPLLSRRRLDIGPMTFRPEASMKSSPTKSTTMSRCPASNSASSTPANVRAVTMSTSPHRATTTCRLVYSVVSPNAMPASTGASSTAWYSATDVVLPWVERRGVRGPSLSKATITVPP